MRVKCYKNMRYKKQEEPIAYLIEEQPEEPKEEPITNIIDEQPKEPINDIIDEQP